MTRPTASRNSDPRGAHSPGLDVAPVGAPPSCARATPAAASKPSKAVAMWRVAVRMLAEASPSPITRIGSRSLWSPARLRRYAAVADWYRASLTQTLPAKWRKRGQSVAKRSSPPFREPRTANPTRGRPKILLLTKFTFQAMIYCKPHHTTSEIPSMAFPHQKTPSANQCALAQLIRSPSVHSAVLPAASTSASVGSSRQAT